MKWANDNKLDWHSTGPGKPRQNDFTEGVKGRTRNECLNKHLAGIKDEARRKLALWRYEYNNVRPDFPFGKQTPEEARRALEQLEISALGALSKIDNQNFEMTLVHSHYE